MATYLQGVTDFIPQVQPFQPDLNFYGGLMQTKQNQYDQNWNSLNKMYGQYFYADLTRDNNIEKKDEYLKDIEFNLKRVSGLDLSLEQNVTQATQVFKPFYEDQFLMKDMAFTKNYMTQRSKGMGLKNSSDEEMRAQYWGTGIKYMDYKREEFKNTTDEESMSFGNINYTPYVNTMEKALKIAKDADLNVENIDFSPDGRWVIKKKNGEALEEPLHKLFEAMLGSDPGIQDVYRVQSVVNRKDYAYGNAAQFGGNNEAAEMDYLQKSYESLKTLNGKRVNSLENQQTVQRTITNKIEKQQEDGNVTIENNTYLNNLREAMGINTEVLTQAQRIQGQLSDGQGTLTTSSGFENPYGDIKSLRQKVDAGMASYLMQKDLGEAAHVFAFRNASVEMDANPYKVLEIRNAAAMARVRERNTGERKNNDRKWLIEEGILKAVPLKDKNPDSPTYGEIIGTDFVQSSDAFATSVITDVKSGLNTGEVNKSDVAQQEAEHYIKPIQNEMVSSITTMVNFMTANNSMSEDDKNYILNGTIAPQGSYLSKEKSTDFVDRLLNPGNASYERDMLDFVKKGTNYKTADAFNADFTDKNLYFNTAKLKDINNRFSEYSSANWPLFMATPELAKPLATYAASSSKYDSHIDQISNFQDFRKKAAGEIITYMKDNKYYHADAAFNTEGQEVSRETFAANLIAKGVMPDAIQRPKDYTWNGERRIVNNENFAETASMIGADRVKRGLAPYQKGADARKRVSTESFSQVDSQVTLHRADGSTESFTGEPENNKWNRLIENSKNYISIKKDDGGWVTSPKWDVYEVNDLNKKSIESLVGEKWIFGGYGGGLGATRGKDPSHAKLYDKYMAAISDTWSNGNVVKADIPGITSYTDGTGLTTFQAEEAMVYPKAYGTIGNTFMNQTIGDIDRIDWDGYNSVITNSLEESAYNKAGDKLEDGTDMTMTQKGRLLYREYKNQFKDPKSKMTAFPLRAYGIASGDQTKGAMVIKLDNDFLDDYAQKVNAKGVTTSGMLSQSELLGFKENGLVLISDKNNFNNGLFSNLYKDAFESTVEYNGEYNYTHPSGVGGFIIDKTPENVGGVSPWRATITYKLFDINTGKYTPPITEAPPIESITQVTKDDLINKLANVYQLNIQQQNIYNARK